MVFGITHSQSINWAADSFPAPIQNMSIDHGCSNILVTQSSELFGYRIHRLTNGSQKNVETYDMTHV